MSGRCYSCAQTFGLFRKELGCKNCGYSFCKECLTQKIALPKHNNVQHRVCNKCYTKLSGQETSKKNVEAQGFIDSKIKPVSSASVGNVQHGSRQDTSASHVAPSGHTQVIKEHPADVELDERLRKLKADLVPTGKVAPSQADLEHRLDRLQQESRPNVTDNQLRQRLAQLQDRVFDPAESSNRPTTMDMPQRPAVDTSDQLIAAVMDEVAIDKRYSADGLSSGDDDDLATAKANDNGLAGGKQREGSEAEEVEQLMRRAVAEARQDEELARQGVEADRLLDDRLARLRQGLCEGDTPRPVSDTRPANVPTSDKITPGSTTALPPDTRLGKKSKAKASSKLPQSLLQADSDDDDAEERNSDEELPWCCICNSDAVLRCHGCDGDLYCKRCFREGHDKYDRKEHTTEAFKVPRNRTVS